MLAHTTALPAGARYTRRQPPLRMAARSSLFSKLARLGRGTPETPVPPVTAVAPVVQATPVTPATPAGGVGGALSPVLKTAKFDEEYVRSERRRLREAYEQAAQQETVWARKLYVEVTEPAEALALRIALAEKLCAAERMTSAPGVEPEVCTALPELRAQERARYARTKYDARSYTWLRDEYAEEKLEALAPARNARPVSTKFHSVIPCLGPAKFPEKCSVKCAITQNLT